MTLSSKLREWLTVWTFISSAIALQAEPFQNEEVLFFDGRPDQTRTENGGTVVYPLDTQQWRFWFRDVYHAAVSPDGSKVAYRYQNSINVADVNGQNPQTLAFDNERSEKSPLSWSPEGHRIAHFRNQDGNGLVNEHGRATRRVRYPFAWVLVAIQSGDRKRGRRIYHKTDYQRTPSVFSPPLEPLAQYHFPTH